jgi:hypothetical protein
MPHSINQAADGSDDAFDLSLASPLSDSDMSSTSLNTPSGSGHPSSDHYFDEDDPQPLHATPAVGTPHTEGVAPHPAAFDLPESPVVSFNDLLDAITSIGGEDGSVAPPPPAHVPSSVSTFPSGHSYRDRRGSATHAPAPTSVVKPKFGSVRRARALSVSEESYEPRTIFPSGWISSAQEPLRNRHGRSASNPAPYAGPFVAAAPPQLPPIETEARRLHRQKEVEKVIVGNRMKALSTVHGRSASSPYYFRDEGALPFELYPILSLANTPPATPPVRETSPVSR